MQNVFTMHIYIYCTYYYGRYKNSHLSSIKIGIGCAHNISWNICIIYIFARSLNIFSQKNNAISMTWIFYIIQDRESCGEVMAKQLIMRFA